MVFDKKVRIGGFYKVHLRQQVEQRRSSVEWRGILNVHFLPKLVKLKMLNPVWFSISNFLPILGKKKLKELYQLLFVRWYLANAILLLNFFDYTMKFNIILLQHLQISAIKYLTFWNKTRLDKVSKTTNMVD